MASSQVPVAWPASGGRPVSFCFSVTWTYLAQPLGSIKIEEKTAHGLVPTICSEMPAESLNCAVRAPFTSTPEFVAPAFPSTASWEMVIPKTSRPSAGPSRAPQPLRTGEPASSIRETPQKPAAVEVPVRSGDGLGLQTPGVFTREPGNSLSVAVKFAAPAFLVLLIAGIVLFRPADPQRAAVAVHASESAAPLPVGLAGWIANFAPPGGSQWGRRISVLRGSQKLTDFRVVFPGQIDRKALGWVFRAQDPKNFYVMKLEIIRPLPLSTGVLTHFAVINGQEQPRVQTPLSMPLRPNTVYTVRLDAVGSSFTTWIQGQKADQWEDAQIRAGAVGLYSEAGERSTLKGDIAVFTLPGKIAIEKVTDAH